MELQKELGGWRVREGRGGWVVQGRGTTHADEGELILFSTCILSMSVCGGERQGGNPPLQAGGGRQKGHSCVAHRIKKVPQSAAGLAPNASSYSSQSPFPPPDLQNFLASLSLCPGQAPSQVLLSVPSAGTGWVWGKCFILNTPASKFQLMLTSRIATLAWSSMCPKHYPRDGSGPTAEQSVQNAEPFKNCIYRLW